MFSAQLEKSAFLELRRAIRPDLPDLYRVAGRINTWMRQRATHTTAGGGFVADRRLPDGLAPLLREFVRLAERWLAKNQAAPYRESLLERYFAVTRFLRVWEVFDDSYVVWGRVTGKDLLLNLFCLDPSPQLKAALQRAQSVVFFSATMTPADYFQEILGCESTATRLAIASPFPCDHFKVVIAGGVSTYYTQRERSLNQVVALIRACVRVKSGNYLCFFPSFAYMAMAVERLRETSWPVRMLVQEREMDTAQRARFLNQFEDPQDAGLVGFAVMGGIFGEGIDLVGERLCGAVIVGVGLPGISPERDLIRDHFDGRGAGFDFAYRFPGLNRVMQAAGRVIRTEHDRGVLMLIDQRFEYAGYHGLLPTHWHPVIVRSARQIEKQLRDFWKDDPEPTNR
jgi:DNA excision repair protein ERCC-2